MKRVLVFLLLFGSGLCLLLWIESRGGDHRPTAPTDPTVPTDPTGATGATGSTETPTQTAAGPRDEGAIITVGSRERVVRRRPAGPDGLRPVLWELSWEERVPLGEDRLELRQVHIDIYDVESSALQAEVDAERGHIALSGGGHGLVLSLEDDVELFGATVTVRDGLPWTPLTLRTSRVSGSLEARSFTTEEPATIEGTGLVARGTGLGLDAEQGRLVLHRDVTAAITAGDGRVVDLSCTDLLGLRRDPDAGVDALLLVVRGSALLAERGGGASSLVGEEIELRGRRTPAADTPLEEGAFMLRRLFARGDVVYTSPEIELSGGEVDLDVAEDGRVERGTLRGEAPRAILLVGAAGAPEPGPDETTPATPVEILGEDVITLRRGARLEAYAPGRARLLWGDVTVEASAGVTGEGSEDGSTADLTAHGDVVVTAPGATLSAPGLTAKLLPDAAGKPTLIATASAPTRTEGRTRSGTPYTFATAGALVAEFANERWSVLEATKAALLLHDESELVARADRVTDFDPRTLAMRATGAVDISGLEGGEPFRATGEELIAETLEHITVRGSADRRATFGGPSAQGEAREVVRDGDGMWAKGEVETHLAADGVAYDLTCDRLRARRRDDADGTTSTVSAEGAVAGTVRLPGRTVELDCATLDVIRSDDLAGARATTVLAEGVQRALVTLADPEGASDEVWEVRCRRLDAGRLVGADGVVQREDLIGREDVVVSRVTPGAPPFVGYGDTLSFDGTQGRLDAAPGGRVRTLGQLPGSGWPFSLNADWVSFAGLRVKAGAPDLRVTRRGEPPAGGGPIPEVPLGAVANEMSASEDAVLFTGDVLLTGESSTDSTWTLETANARLEGYADGDPGAGDEGASWRTVRAWGGYVFRLGATTRSEGLAATMVAGTERLFLEGDLASLSMGGFHMQSPWIEFDMRTNSWRSGAGTLGQAVQGPPR